MEFSGAQIFRHDIVRICRGHILRDRQADTLGENPRRKIAEVPAGHGNDQRHRGYRQLPVSRHVCLFSSASEKACFTRRWQSSNEPATSSAVMFSPSVVNCFSWASLMRFEG